MRYLLIISIITALWFAKKRFFLKRIAGVIQSHRFDPQPILDELMMCGELADVVHLEDKAGYGFIPLSGGLYRPSIAEISCYDAYTLEPAEVAHKVIREWNKNDEIALNPALDKMWIVKDGMTMPLHRSVRWLDK